MFKSKLNKVSLIVFTACMATSTAFAATIDKTEYRTTQNKIITNYSTSKAACKPLGNFAKDVCIEQAKGKEQVARAELEYRYTGTAKDAKNISVVKADTTFSLAKKLCNNKADNTKDICIAQAKSNHVKAISASDMMTDVIDLSKERSNELRAADYKVAKEKCDAFFGESKDTCVTNAKKQYGQ